MDTLELVFSRGWYPGHYFISRKGSAIVIGYVERQRNAPRWLAWITESGVPVKGEGNSRKTAVWSALDRAEHRV